MSRISDDMHEAYHAVQQNIFFKRFISELSNTLDALLKNLAMEDNYENILRLQGSVRLVSELKDLPERLLDAAMGEDNES